MQGAGAVRSVGAVEVADAACAKGAARTTGTVQVQAVSGEGGSSVQRRSCVRSFLLSVSLRVPVPAFACAFACTCTCD